MVKGNITPISGGGKPDKFKEAVRAMKEQLSDQIEFQQLVAKLQRAKYVALIEEGFTPAEALELCKTF